MTQSLLCELAGAGWGFVECVIPGIFAGLFCNPNIPLRFLLYIAEEYDEIIRRQDANIYGSKLVMLPAPQCVVFYNGDRETEDEELLRLSDCFQNRRLRRPARK
ncbi:MAG: hypothetical protein HDR02_19425 [Lachnospiraceae bacterium]|nr:hypothetical protein [Lachnospiraceae bacterium]